MAKVDPISLRDCVLTDSICPPEFMSRMGDMAERLTDVLFALRRVVKDIDDELDLIGDANGISYLVDQAQDYAECLRALVTKTTPRWAIFSEDAHNLELAKLANGAASGGAH